MEIHITDVMRIQHHGVQVCWQLLEENILCEAVESELGAMRCDIIAGMFKLGKIMIWPDILYFHAKRAH